MGLSKTLNRFLHGWKEFPLRPSNTSFKFYTLKDSCSPSNQHATVQAPHPEPPFDEEALKLAGDFEIADWYAKQVHTPHPHLLCHLLLELICEQEDSFLALLPGAGITAGQILFRSALIVAL
jgi:hypothetical protein